MSKYDVEVEARLQALEAKVAALESSDKAQQEVDARFLALEDKVSKDFGTKFLYTSKIKWRVVARGGLHNHPFAIINILTL